MLALRSLRARLLIIGVVPVVVALAVTAVLAARSVDRFADEQQAVKRAEQVRALRGTAQALSKLYSDRLGEAFRLGELRGVNRDYLEEAYGGDLFYVALVSSGNLNAERLGLRELELKLDDLPEPLVRRLAAGRSVAVPADALPPALRGDVAVARGIFPTADAAPLGLLVVVQPAAEVTSPVSALRRALVPAFAIGTGVAILLALLLGLRLVRPLRRLAAAARAVARGDEEVELDTQRADEIGMVNRAFADMTHRLAEARDTERLFLMRVSHELRTPLTAIRSQVDALADGIFDDPETQAAAYAAITAESARLSRLVGDLLDLARLQARRFGLEADEVDLNVLLDQVVTGQGGEARERGIEMALQAGQLPVVIGDGDRILQIVSNLVRNAVRWTPDGGRITVSALAEAGRVWITVDDSGPGIPQDRRGTIFQAFYSEDGTGTGLGLAIARELALAMGGSVVVGDSPHGGARFVVELPCVIARSGSPAAV